MVWYIGRRQISRISKIWTLPATGDNWTFVLNLQHHGNVWMLEHVGTSLHGSKSGPDMLQGVPDHQSLLYPFQIHPQWWVLMAWNNTATKSSVMIYTLLYEGWQMLYCIKASLHLQPSQRAVINLPTILRVDLWKVTGQEDINVEIRKRKVRWIDHTLRKEDGEIPKAALLWNPQGNRKRGRPRNSWRSVIKEVGRSWNELRFLAAHRRKWKGLIDNLCS